MGARPCEKPLTSNSRPPAEMRYNQRMTVAAAASSAISTVAGFPLDSVKSRLQVKRYSGVLDCVSQTYAQEGIRGFMRGIWVPLGTITVVRTLSFSIYSGTKNVLKGYVEGSPNKWQIAGLGFAGGASSGILISTGSCAFELVKVRCLSSLGYRVRS